MPRLNRPNCLALCIPGILLMADGWVVAQVPSIPLASPQAGNPTLPKSLSKDDADKVEAIQATIKQLCRAEKFSEGIEPSRQVLTLCEQVLGGGHWQTVDARVDLQTLQQIANLPKDGRKAMAEVTLLLDRWSELRRRGEDIEGMKIAKLMVDTCEKYLGRDHFSTAEAYNALAVNLNNNGNPAGARELYEKSLEICKLVKGEDHPDLASIHNNLALSLDAMAKFSEAEIHLSRALDIRRENLGKDHLVTAASYNNLASHLEKRGKYHEAEPLLRDALRIYEAKKGINAADTGTIHANLAINLDKQAKYPDAELHHRRALDIQHEEPGEDHVSTALTRNNWATHLHTIGKLAEAEQQFILSLKVFLRKLDPDHPLIAEVYSSIAVVLDEQGRKPEAESFHRQALAIRLKVLGSNHPDTAASFSNLGTHLDGQQKNIEAESFHRQALAIRLKALEPNHPDTAISYHNLAVNLGVQERYAEAQALFDKAVEVRLITDPNGLGIARTYLAIGTSLDSNKEYKKAEEHYRKALDKILKTFGENHLLVATARNNLAINLLIQGKFAESEGYLRLAIGSLLKTFGPDHSSTASAFLNLGYLLDAQGKVEEAMRAWESASKGFENRRIIGSVNGLEQALVTGSSSSVFHPMAIAQARRGQAREAWTSWESSLARGTLDDHSARQLKSMTPDQRAREADLIGQLQDHEERIGELAANPHRTQEQDGRLDRLRQQESRIRGEFVTLENTLNAHARLEAGRPALLKEIQTALPDRTALIGWVDLSLKGPPDWDRSPYHWACLVQRGADPLWLPIKGTGPAGQWSKPDDDRPNVLRKAISDRSEDWYALAATLAEQRLGPLRPHLQGIDRLIVLPSWSMAGIPIEALLAAHSEEGQAKLPFVSYAPSATMFAMLSRAKGADVGPPRLLAVGDPAFPLPTLNAPFPPPPSRGIVLITVPPNGNAGLAGLESGDVLLAYNGIELNRAGALRIVPREGHPGKITIKYWRRGEFRTAEVASGSLMVRDNSFRPIEQAFQDLQAAKGTLDPVNRGVNLDRLPGTRREVEAIAALFPADRRTVLLGDDATEAALQQLARADQLKSYRHILLATHGRADTMVAMNSALFFGHELAIPGKPPTFETDGRVTAQQIVNTWNLDADLVVLSACDSGLGRLTSGEGYLGFAQALFVKGARGVILSLWKVDDTPTALLMQRFYKNLLVNPVGADKPLSKAEALAEAKAWLRSLDVSQAEKAMKENGLVAPTLNRPGGDRGRGDDAIIPNPPPGAVHRPFGHPHNWAAFVLIGNPN